MPSHPSGTTSDGAPGARNVRGGVADGAGAAASSGRAWREGAADRRGQVRAQSDVWQTSLTSIGANKILLRGYPLDEMMGRLGFAEAVYLLLMGELPTPAIGRMLNAVLVSSLDHGVTPPSTLAARNVATSGAPLQQAADGLVLECIGRNEVPPGFGHRFHTRDPRAARLFQMALELELEGEHVRLLRAIERALQAHEEHFERPMPVNVDGAIAAVCADLGFAYELGNAVFLISRLPGLIAHAYEERSRQTPMRQIDPKDHDYDGARERRLPEGRT